MTDRLLELFPEWTLEDAILCTHWGIADGFLTLTEGFLIEEEGVTPALLALLGERYKKDLTF